jgi:hypothetical protein
LGRWQRISVECHTVDSYQGRQADIVLYSMRRSNKDRRLGFIRERPRLNVALSRARDLLVIVGDHAFARDAKGSEAVKRVIDHMEACPDECRFERARVGMISAELADRLEDQRPDFELVAMADVGPRTGACGSAVKCSPPSGSRPSTNSFCERLQPV